MIILDTNVIMEILEKRNRQLAVIELLQQYGGEEIAVTTLTLSSVFYLVESHKTAVNIAEQLLKTYKVVAVTSEDAGWAFAHYNGKDFEDALQIAAALREKCTAFLTIDAMLARKYSKFLDIKLVGA